MSTDAQAKPKACWDMCAKRVGGNKAIPGSFSFSFLIRIYIAAVAYLFLWHPIVSDIKAIQ